MTICSAASDFLGSPLRLKTYSTGLGIIFKGDLAVEPDAFTIVMIGLSCISSRPMSGTYTTAILDINES